MDIRVNPKFQSLFNEAYAMSSKINKTTVKLTFDPAVESAVMMGHRDGKFVEWFRGVDPALSFITHGYVRITKLCPFLRGFLGQPRKCIAEKCAHYVIRNTAFEGSQLGDCAHVWTALNR